MRNKVILLLLSIISLSCSVQNNSKSIINEKPRIINEDLQTPNTVFVPSNNDRRSSNEKEGLDLYSSIEINGQGALNLNSPDIVSNKYTCNTYCEKEPIEKITFDNIKNLVDFDISKDGKTLYFTTRKNIEKLQCDDFSPYSFPTAPSSYTVAKLNTKLPDEILKNGYIYTIKDNKKDIVKINGKAPISCVLGEEIELDDNNNLYIMDFPNNQLFKANLAKESLEESSNKIEKDKEKSLFFKYSKIRTYQDKVYYLLVGYNSIEIFELKDGNKKIVYTDKSLKEVYFNKQSGAFRNISDLDYLVTEKGIYFNFDKNKSIGLGVSFFDFESSKLIEYFPNESEFKDKNRNINSIAINSYGDIFASDDTSNGIWKIDIDKKIELFVGSFESNFGYQDDKKTKALFKYPSILKTDSKNNLYVADMGNNAIRKITPDGIVSTLYKE